MIKDKSYPAKVLLFGEYTIINGGQALAMPCHKYSGRLVEGPKSTLKSFFEYLMTIKGYDVDKLYTAIKKDLSFDSTIPQGYGLGSSGALTAAAFDLFYPDKPQSTAELKNLLSQSENFFHGNSSGLDPLTIYLNQALIVEGDRIETLPELDLNNKFALIDSGQTRNTKSLVSYYSKQLQNPDFSSAIVHLNALNEQAIHAIVSLDQNLKSIMAQISQLQFDFFQHMIPDSVRGIWKRGLDSGEYFMKLSGAGGGGFFLVFGECDSLEGSLVL
ncbi:hypothetical protein N9L92_00765 [Saprospiraceae bacterium]|nr:hypothetical protein [Saprospiraceae bacterium]